MPAAAKSNARKASESVDKSHASKKTKVESESGSGSESGSEDGSDEEVFSCSNVLMCFLLICLFFYKVCL